MADAPKRIWANLNYAPPLRGVLSGTLEIEPSEIAKQVEYTRTDIADKLAEALEGIVNLSVSDSASQWRKEVEKARAALAEYRT